MPGSAGRPRRNPSQRPAAALLDRAAVSFQVVLTKADKKGAALDGTVAAVRAALAKHPAAHPEVALTSSETGAGIPELRAAIAALAVPA